MITIKFILLTIILLTATCKQGGTISQLNKTHHQQRVKVKQSQEFTVTLPANPTTGFRWMFVDSLGTRIKQVGKTTFHANSTQIGAGGEQTLRFRATLVGQTELKLIYHRSWEAKTAPADEFVVTIDVIK